MAHSGEKGLVGKLEGRALGRTNLYDYNIKMDLKGIGRDGVGWFVLAQNREN